MAGITDRTIRRWLQDREFSHRLQAAQDNRIAEEKIRISTLRDTAFTALQELLEPETPKAIRLGAIRTALGTAERSSDAEIDARLVRLEAHQEEPPPWNDD
jgi:hypothetical protein